MKTNLKMSVLLEESHHTNELLQTSSLKRILHPIIKDVYGCSVIDNEDEIDVDRIDFDTIIERHGDRTGYEASCNDTRINDYIDDDTIEHKELISIGLEIIEMWMMQLKSLYPGKRFTFIMSSDSVYVTLRFYQIRDNDVEYLCDNLEDYEEAIAVITN